MQPAIELDLFNLFTWICLQKNSVDVVLKSV